MLYKCMVVLYSPKAGEAKVPAPTQSTKHLVTESCPGSMDFSALSYLSPASGTCDTCSEEFLPIHPICQAMQPSLPA